MKIGISTGCLYPMLTEDCISTLTGIGFDTFEIFFNTFSELEKDYLDKLKTHLERFGSSVVSIHPFTSSYESFLLFSNYERRFLDGVSLYEMYFRAAQYIGADKVVLHGLSTDYSSSLSNAEYCRRFELLQKKAACYGVKLLQENVVRFRSGIPDFIMDMREQIPESAFFVCDTKQAFRSGVTPLDEIKIMGKSLRHIHISDNDINNKCVLPGKGRFDIEEFIKYLAGLKYDGDIIIEVYRFSFDKLSELTESKEYLEYLVYKYF